MIQIIFNNNQLSDLKSFYEDRLTKLNHQCEGIQNILNQLEMITKESSISRSIANLLGNNEKNSLEKISISREYQHHEWAKFILTALTERKTLCPSIFFLNRAIKEFHLDEKQKSKIKMIINTYLSKMCRVDKTLKAYKSINVSEKLYGLSEWFDDEDEPLDLYRANQG